MLRRVDRTFAFIDLSGFTAFNERAGDEQAVDVLVEFRNAVRNIASKRGVRIAKWLGDGVMLVGVEPEETVDSVLEINSFINDSDFELPVRAGIAVCDPYVPAVTPEDLRPKPVTVAPSPVPIVPVRVSKVVLTAKLST
mgnify:CR=1 FL=1